MKRIWLKVLPDPEQPDNPVVAMDYRETIKQAIRVPLNRQSGATIDEMRQGIRILDALDSHTGDVLELEDADWEHLKAKVQVMPWAMVDRRFITFHDDIVGATEKSGAPRSNGVAVA